MNTTIERKMYDKLLQLRETTSVKGYVEILDRTSRLLAFIEVTPFYKSIAEETHNNREANVRLFDVSFKIIKKAEPDADASVILWLVGLRASCLLRNLDCLLNQLSVFIIAQRENIYRIEDDKLRVLTTFTYLRTMAKIIDDLKPVA